MEFAVSPLVLSATWALFVVVRRFLIPTFVALAGVCQVMSFNWKGGLARTIVRTVGGASCVQVARLHGPLGPVPTSFLEQQLDSIHNCFAQGRRPNLHEFGHSFPLAVPWVAYLSITISVLVISRTASGEEF